MNPTFWVHVYFSNTKYEVLCATSVVTSPKEKKKLSAPRNKNSNFILFYTTLNDLTLEVWLFERLL
jgi:hypothetical protein